MDVRIAVAVLLAGCVIAAWFRTGRGQAPDAGRARDAGRAPKAPRGRRWDFGWSAGLIAVALGASGWLHGNGWLTYAVPVAAGAVAVLAPRQAARLTSLALIALGLYGYVIARKYAFNSYFKTSYGLLPRIGSESIQYYLVLPEAYAFLAGGGWLLWRTLDRRSRATRLLLGRLVSREGGRQPWFLLLLPVALMAADLLTPNLWFVDSPWGIAWTLAVVLTTLLFVRRAPAFAADLAVVGLFILGLAGPYILRNWGDGAGIFLIPRTFNYDAVLYGSVSIASRSMAYLACGQGLAFLGLAAWLAPRTIGAHLRLTVAPDAELARRVQRLTETRTAAVDTAATDLRRLERNLHDGAQARLVALGMSLREAERLIPTSPDVAAVLIAGARQTSAKALTELRELVRGVHPPVLADRGLGDAVRALALDVPVNVETAIDLPGRLPDPVESACYFAVAEILTNIAKHAEARHAQVRIEHSGRMLRIEVSDDGVGGADAAKGTGLAGIERRLAVLDGILAVSSPLGGPTMVVLEVPCALSSPKTSSC
jgi:signal transduction histidine kinase